MLLEMEPIFKIEHLRIRCCAMLSVFTFLGDEHTYLSVSIVTNFRKSRVLNPIFSKSQYEIEGAKSLLPLTWYGNNVYLSCKEKGKTDG